MPHPYSKHGWDLEPDGDGYVLIIPFGSGPHHIRVTDADLDTLRSLSSHRDLPPTGDQE